MMLIGLAGSAGSGKDTVADYLVAQHGFTKFSFSDALYREVSEAFSIPIDELKHRDGKELPHPKLVEAYCKDPEFAKLMRAEADYRYVHDAAPIQQSARWVSYSPRWVLQHWGTEYRRAQDPDYWLKAASLWVQAWLDVTKDDGQEHAGLVNASVRFPNEQAWIDEMQGTVWHVRRRDVTGVASEMQHSAEQQLPVRAGDRTLSNDAGIEELNTAVSLLLSAPPLALVGDAAECACETACCDEREVVSCDTCGRLHIAYTAEQVQYEVDLFNSSFDMLSDDIKGQVGRQAEVKDYVGCMQCGGESFHKFHQPELSDERKDALSPVLCEGDI